VSAVADQRKKATAVAEELAAAEAEAQRVDAAWEASLDAYAAAKDAAAGAEAEIAAAELLEPEVALGEREAGEVATMRAAAVEKRDAAAEQMRRQDAVAKGLQPRREEARQAVAVLRVAEVAGRIEAVSDKAREVVAGTLAERFLAALKSSRTLCRMRAELVDLEAEGAQLAEAAGVDAPTRSDELDFRPEGWELLVELLEGGPCTPVADVAERAESERQAEAAAEERERNLPAELSERAARVLARESGWRRVARDAAEKNHLRAVEQYVLTQHRVPADWHERTLDRAAELRAALVSDHQALRDRLEEENKREFYAALMADGANGAVPS
jgi:hypothetical protein